MTSSTTLSGELGRISREHAMLDTKEAAAALGVTPWWVRRLIDDGELRTVSDISAWQLEVGESEIVKVDAKRIPAADTATLRTGMMVSIDVSVTEETGPAGEVKPKYTATAFSILGDE